MLQGVLLAALVTPLVMLPNTFYFPFATSKAWFFRLVVVLALLTFIFVSRGRLISRFSITPVFYAVMVFFCAYGLATVLSVDVHRSFWGNHERMMGLLTMGYFTVFFLLLRFAFRKEHSWRIFWAVFCVVAMIVTGLGFYQSGHPDFLIGNGSRESITFGNPLYVGQYSLYVFFMGLYWFADTWKKRREGTQPWLWFWGVSIVCAMALLYMSETRSAFLGLLGGGFLMTATLSVFSQRKKVRKRALSFFILAGLGASLLVSPLGGTLFNSFAPYSRFADMSALSANNANRLFAWRVGLKAWQENPVFGTGPYTFAFSFNRLFESRQLVGRDFTDTWFDTSHNHYIDVLVEQGAVGLLAVAALYASIIWVVAAAARKGRISLSGAVIVVGLVVAIAIVNFFMFEQISSYVSLFSLLAFVGFLGSKRPEEHSIITKGRSKPVLVGGAAAVLAMAYYSILVPAQANASMLSATLEAARSGSVEPLILQANNILDKSVAHQDHLLSKLASLILKTEHVPPSYKDSMIALFELTLDGLERQRIKHPHDISIPMLLGPLWHKAFQLDQEHFASGREVGDRHFLSAVTLSPHRQQLYAYWGNQIIKSGNEKAAKQPFGIGLAMAPSASILYSLHADYLMLVERPSKQALHLYRWGMEDGLLSVTTERLARMLLTIAQLNGSQEALENADVILACFEHMRGEAPCRYLDKIDPLPSIIQPLEDLRKQIASGT